MSQRVDLQPGFVLHSRRYRDTSLIVELWTAQWGRVAAVARGARQGSRRSQRVALQAFQPLLVSWSGRGSLKTLTTRESAGAAVNLVGKRLYSGLYVNELLVRLLAHEDPHPELYAAYVSLLDALAERSDLDVQLRQFEFLLLEELGYGISLEFDAEAGEPIAPELDYCYLPETGLVQLRGDRGELPVFTGASLLALAEGRYDTESRSSAKRLLRQALAAQLGPKPLHSRRLFNGG